MFGTTKLGLVAVLVLAMTAVPALCDTMTYNGLGLNQTVTLKSENVNVTTPAGQLLVTYQGESYKGYCVDIHQYAGSGNVTETSVSSLHNGNYVAYLFETYSQSADTSLEAAALQVAIWEVLNENGSNFNATQGTTKITGNNSVATAANLLLSSMPTSYVPAWSYVLGSSCKQDVIIGTNNTSVPEPATMSLLAIGGVLAAWRRRKA